MLIQSMNIYLTQCSHNNNNNNKNLLKMAITVERMLLKNVVIAQNV